MWEQGFPTETVFCQDCKNRIKTPSGKKKLCNYSLTLLFVISTFLNSYIGMLPGEKINDDTWSISGEIYIIESKGTCTCFHFMFVLHSLSCNIQLIRESYEDSYHFDRQGLTMRAIGCLLLLLSVVTASKHFHPELSIVKGTALRLGLVGNRILYCSTVVSVKFFLRLSYKNFVFHGQNRIYLSYLK